MQRKIQQITGTWPNKKRKSLHCTNQIKECFPFFMITGCSSLPIKKNEWIQSGKSTGMNRRRNDRSRRFFPTGAGGGEETRTNIKSGEQYRKPNSLPFENCTSPWYFWKSVSPLPQSPMKKITKISLHSFFVRQIGATDGYWSLCHRTEDWIVPTNAGTVFFVCSFRVTYLVKLRLLDKKENVSFSWNSQHRH